ncbi:MAG: hypothetical protein R2788_27055 [Saprospiraceae bacterium]
MNKKIIKPPYRIILLLTLLLILAENITLTLLIPDISAYFEILIHLLILYFVIKNHRFTAFAIWLWATLYLFAYTAVRVSLKSLIIMRGDGWEIDSARFYLEVFLLSLGFLLMFFADKIYVEKEG